MTSSGALAVNFSLVEERADVALTKASEEAASFVSQSTLFFVILRGSQTVG